ncbi:peptide chain release factor N(5)-glutamine methyltransferase [Desulfococcaceae bacterium HSG9]|nr:peptide chain release factor N(5)-glutamine methyltransferase [Desulfococcaceae bacterium HSG9]
MRNQGNNTTPEWTILKLLQWTAAYFKKYHIESPRTCAELLLAHTLSCQRLELYLEYDKPLDAPELAIFKAFIKRRIAGEPVAYIEGRKGFWKQVLEVSDDVLIPRPETECLVEAALEVIPEGSSKSPRHILELGVGSGAVTLALASERPDNIFWASDLSNKALLLAKRNVLNYNTDADILFLTGNWLEPFVPKPIFNLIISNPPYIRTGDLEHLQPEIYKYEPLIALDGGADGLNAIRHIICKAHRYLKQQGYLLLEIGHDQEKAVRDIAKECGNYKEIEFIKDYNDHKRVVRMGS